MTRDSRLLWVGMAGAIMAALAIHPDLIEGLMRGDKKDIATTVCLLLAVLAGKLQNSPLPHSDDSDKLPSKF